MIDGGYDPVVMVSPGALAEFRRLADDLPVFVWTHGLDGRVEWANRLWLEYTGLPEQIALTLEGLARVVHPDDLEIAEARFRAMLASGEGIECELRIRPADKPAYRWFVVRIVPRLGESGVRTGWIGSAVDIQDARMQQRATAQLEFFARLGEELAGTLEVHETVDAVQRLLVPAFADTASVALGARGAESFSEGAIRVPIRRTGAVHGMLEVRYCGSERTYAHEDVPFFAEIARRIGPALENAEAFERERRVARTFQEAALQPELPHVPGLVFDAIYEAGRSDALIGGDWYDAFRIPDGRVVVSVGDVSGSGLDAAVTMASVRQGIRMVSGVNPDPNVLLDAADRALRASDRERFVTAFVGVIDPVFGTMTWASAGHPPPLLRLADGTVLALRGTEPPLGLRGRIHEAPSSVELERGDLLVLYTDGLVEASRDIIEGERRALEAVAMLDDVERAAEALYDDMLTLGHPNDDVAILTVAFECTVVEAVSTRRAWRWTFDAKDRETAHRVRASIAAQLGLAGADSDARATAELVFGELIGNVVRYAPGTVDVVLDLSGDAPVLHVVDEGEGFEHNPKLPADQLSERGRGLFIVAALSEELYVSRRPRGGSHARAVLYAPASTYRAGAMRGSDGWLERRGTAPAGAT